MSDTVAEAITRLQNAKSSIKTSIENKGVTVPSEAKIESYADYVMQIQSGDGDDIIHYMSGILAIDSGMIYISNSDRVNNRYGDYSWKDGEYLYLVKPYEYDDYSSSGHSYMNTNVYCMALAKGASSTVNYDANMYQGGYYTSTRLMYYYINGNSIKIYGATGEYNDTYWCKEMKFENGSWSMTNIGWDGTTPSQTGGDQNLFYSSVEGSTSGGGNFYYKWKPN